MLCLATMGGILVLCGYNGIDKQGLDKQYKGIWAVENWVENEFKEEQIALLALEVHVFADLKSGTTTVKKENEEPKVFPKTDVKQYISAVTSFRKEFKIHGQIEAQKGLSFVSLTR